jgi:hypothetical protein
MGMRPDFICWKGRNKRQEWCKLRPPKIIVRADWQKVTGIIRKVLIVVIMIGIGSLGRKVTPTDTSGNLLILSPRVAYIAEYQRKVQGWTSEMEQIEDGIRELLADNTSDLFTQDSKVQKVFQQAENLESKIDETNAPDTLTGLQDLMVEAVKLHRGATSAVAQWVSEPSDKTLENVRSSLVAAKDTLDRVYQNPWLQISKPGRINTPIP